MGPRFNGVEDGSAGVTSGLTPQASMGPRFNGVEDDIQTRLDDRLAGASMGPRFNGVEDQVIGGPREFAGECFNGATL